MKSAHCWRHFYQSLPCHPKSTTRDKSDTSTLSTLVSCQILVCGGHGGHGGCTIVVAKGVMPSNNALTMSKATILWTSISWYTYMD